MAPVCQVSYLAIRQLEAVFESHVHEEGIDPWMIDNTENLGHAV